MKALEGVRILDMTHVQSGPTCTQLLAWFGADVIKVERPGKGDATRSQLRDIPDVDSLYFTMLNHNKRSVTLNTKHDGGKAIFTRLLESCDVIAENFAPGALDRMGFPWERIQQINPRIIYASVKGFGRRINFSWSLAVKKKPPALSSNCVRSTSTSSQARVRSWERQRYWRSSMMPWARNA